MLINTHYIVCYLLLIFKSINSLSIIKRHDDCVLDGAKIREIKSYKNITTKIMNDIKNTELGPNMYKMYTEFIDKFGARPSGTEVLERAIDYMVNLTVDQGLQDVATEELEVPHWTRKGESVEMLEPRYKRIAVIGLGPSIPTPDDGITAELVVVKTFDELNNLTDDFVKGKIVLFDETYTTYGETVQYRVHAAAKAALKGAVASLIRSVTPFSLYTPHTGYQHYEKNITKIPTAAITVEDASLLNRMYKRKQKIVLKIKMFSTYDRKKSRNTIIDLKGTTYPDNYVIVSGHIDSWDVGQGAMDDGGGMMISWFAPVVLNHLKFRPKRTLRAILWTAEEAGLVGAGAYLKRHTDELDKINFIMESDEGTFKPLGLDLGGSKTTRCIVAEILKLFSPIDKVTESGYPGSDIVLFVDKGVPGASLLNQNEKYFWFHHTEADTMDVQNKEDVISCAAFWAAVSYVIADLSFDMPRQ